MKGKITKIHPLKESRTQHSYYRIEFLLENGEWAKTDIVPAYRNYRNWKLFITTNSANFVEGLILRKKGEIDADSPVKVCLPFELIGKKDNPIVQEKLI